MKHTLFILFFIFILPCLAGCGKKTMPEPRQATQTFAWNGAKAEVHTEIIQGIPMHVLNITADITGAQTRIKQFVIEVEPQSGDTCGGCPFLPEEMSVIEPTHIIYAANGTRYSFTYHPQKQSDAYRWRLAAHSDRTGVPHVLSKVYGPTTR